MPLLPTLKLLVISAYILTRSVQWRFVSQVGFQFRVYKCIKLFEPVKANETSERQKIAGTG